MNDLVEYVLNDAGRSTVTPDSEGQSVRNTTLADPLRSQVIGNEYVISKTKKNPRFLSEPGVH